MHTVVSSCTISKPDRINQFPSHTARISHLNSCNYGSLRVTNKHLQMSNNENKPVTIPLVPPFKHTYLEIWGTPPQSHSPGPHTDSFSYTPGWWQWTCPAWRSAADVLSWTVDCSCKQWCLTGQESKLEPKLLKTSWQLTFKVTAITFVYYSTCPLPCQDRYWECR